MYNVILLTEQYVSSTSLCSCITRIKTKGRPDDDENENQKVMRAQTQAQETLSDTKFSA